MVSGTIWSLVPPAAAIALALLTKEVYLSLMIGILAGGLLCTGFHPLRAVEVTFGIMGDRMGENINIILFLALLGIIVSLITRSGASKAYGEWASRTIRSSRGALLATAALGAMIFVDDYFNCLTVGTVMRPVTDKYQVTRAKLAYIIDATAAPVCIIAPVSSWAAAVGSSLPEGSGIDGFSLFLQTIPLNLYAWFTLAFMLYLTAKRLDFSAMKRYEDQVRADGQEKTADGERELVTGRGQVIDLILPIAALIVLCVSAMLYTGGILEGKTAAAAFAGCDSAKSLVLGAFFTLIFLAVLYLPRRVVLFSEMCESISAGVKSMVPAIIILSLAWSLSGICGEEYLNIGGFVGQAVGGSALVGALLPAGFFVIGAGLSFSTGTSWGTFGILVPIALAVTGTADQEMLALSVASILAGAVCGDHMSPISDTTILASAGARCHHISHVSTQLPYALCVAACCLAGYLAGGLAGNGFAAIFVGAAALILLLAVVTVKAKKSGSKIEG
ncbi:sodium:proton antiporter [Lachnoclostridium sp. An14]|uniref:Na+/H+ antiporter NhaC family protein n=1 Tax=Lachnoclostridium sp. An14 TaxID=1965562 RepID=UPI000B3AD8A8|nr:Na+/H+ antiporter NhaC family protein [Lachnoclostridium sp. An14]OUQ16224.1 sodium:proton antiporter [Lachnoclostridium sp. An14]